ncbi:ZIP-like iron-zinc transporter [Rhodocollybia butyracea]|uniref:ZIP-like iron-zinc transporter n=1 Tax=Rhodocollybia butyracea TaxID=206335 RepID=A0A9P5PUV9_9AGAR|nr:ZIP-like iron-zinc transporter [Rhodocollybia butyracea]
MSDSTATNCGSGGGADTFFGLRIVSVFVILVGSLFGSLFPVIAARHSKIFKIPKGAFEFAKWFGSGVIIATAFIHLLAPATTQLNNPCLAEGWQEYPYAIALCLLGIIGIFLLELVAFRWGTAKLAKIGLAYDVHGHEPGSYTAHGPGSYIVHGPEANIASNNSPDGNDEKILEEARPLSSLPVFVGLTLAVDPDFKILFVVLVFHQTFEGLGVGARLAYLQPLLPPNYRNVGIWGGILYGITTPIGIAAGLGVRSTYNPGSTTASIVSGVMDSLSAGILIYTGLVELLAHEFLFSTEMQNSTNIRLARCIITMMLGCGLMALLGKWA